MKKEKGGGRQRQAVVKRVGEERERGRQTETGGGKESGWRKRKEEAGKNRRW